MNETKTSYIKLCLDFKNQVTKARNKSYLAVGHFLHFSITGPAQSNYLGSDPESITTTTFSPMPISHSAFIKSNKKKKTN